jgi:hypothetical protein
MSEPQTTRELYDDIVAKRGGIAKFSPAQVRLTHALVVALAKPNDIDPQLVARLIEMLPPLVKPPEERAPIPPLCFVDGYSHQLQRAIE